MATGKGPKGKPYAGNSHVRFDEGEVALESMPRRWPLPNKKLLVCCGAIFFAFMGSYTCNAYEYSRIESDCTYQPTLRVSQGEKTQTHIHPVSVPAGKRAVVWVRWDSAIVPVSCSYEFKFRISPNDGGVWHCDKNKYTWTIYDDQKVYVELSSQPDTWNEPIYATNPLTGEPYVAGNKTVTASSWAASSTYTISVTYEDMAPDMTVSGLTTTPKAEAAIDESITLSYTIRNAGGAAAGASTAHLYDGNTLVRSFSVPSLSSGASASGRIVLPQLSTGKHVLKVCADATDVIAESREGNNEATVSILVYERTPYKVRFDANGGSGTMPDQSFVAGTPQELLANRFTNGDWQFAGWSTSKEGEPEYYDRQTLVALTFSPGATITLYAVWRHIWTVDNNGILTAVDLGRNRDVVIPEGITGIGASVFAFNTNLTSIVLPDSVTNIDSRAFENCKGLTNIVLSANLITIGSQAFSYCNLKEVVIPPSVVNIEGGAFIACNLKKVVIPPSVVNMGGYAFQNCTNLTEVIVSGSVGTIARDTFKWCKNLSRVVLSEGITNIATQAFSGCESLKDIVIPSSVARIEHGVFHECTSLRRVIFTCTGKVPVIQASADQDLKNITYLFGLYGKDTAAACTVYVRRDCHGFEAKVLDNRKQRIYDYLVDFNATDGEMEGVVYPVMTGSAVGELPTPLREGYAFSGWWTAVIGGEPVTTETVIATDVVFFAHWDLLAAITYKVTLGKNGGTGGDNYVTATYGKPMPTPRTAPTLSGYTFAGYWDTLALDEKGNPKGKQYYNGSMKSVRSWDKKSATTLWVKWMNKVTFGKNGGTGGDSYVTCTKGQPMPKRTMPTKSGYVFDGYWTSTGAGGVKYYNTDGTSAHTWDKSGSVTLWAKWRKAAVVKVTLGKNNGSGGDNYVTCTEGQPMPTPRTAPTRAGWTFAGYWDTLAQDANGNPKGKQYYDKDMKSVRNFDKSAEVTLWAKWTVRVTLGKNGGTGGDDYVTVTYNQPFPKRTMPKKTGYTFGGYFVSASSKTGQCYNADGTGTASMKWSTGGTPTIWALWTKTSSCVETAQSAAVPAAFAASSVVPAGIYSGVLADGTGTFWLMLDEPEEGCDRTAYLYVASEGGTLTAECTVEESDGLLLLATEGGETFAVDPAAGSATPLYAVWE